MATSPKNRLSEPTVPADVVGAKPGNCQHSRTEEPLEVAMAVRLSDGVVMLDSWADEKLDMLSKVVRKSARGILGWYIFTVLCPMSYRRCALKSPGLVPAGISIAFLYSTSLCLRHVGKPR